MTEPDDAPKQNSPTPLSEVVQALVRCHITHDVAWWLAHLDRKVWELEERVKKLEKGYDIG